MKHMRNLHFDLKYKYEILLVQCQVQPVQNLPAYVKVIKVTMQKTAHHCQAVVSRKDKVKVFSIREITLKLLWEGKFGKRLWCRQSRQYFLLRCLSDKTYTRKHYNLTFIELQATFNRSLFNSVIVSNLLPNLDSKNIITTAIINHNTNKNMFYLLIFLSHNFCRCK